MLADQHIRVLHIVVSDDLLIEKHRGGADLIQNGNVSGCKIHGIADRKRFCCVLIPPWRVQIDAVQRAQIIQAAFPGEYSRLTQSRHRRIEHARTRDNLGADIGQQGVAEHRNDLYVIPFLDARIALIDLIIDQIAVHLTVGREIIRLVGTELGTAHKHAEFTLAPVLRGQIGNIASVFITIRIGLGNVLGERRGRRSAFITVCFAGGKGADQNGSEQNDRSKSAKVFRIHKIRPSFFKNTKPIPNEYRTQY